ncbi:DUF974-domain-containing protein [Lactarius akahatsu]|uniref:DUF974-domain-containing protein n=1 Tax=Lactarius akahatsu TaxID=416441 RepID=A0AAD4LQY1_9AGAM|nr:DUF974-domain-containing protein [Lactarius akahatsu]
MDGPGHLLSLKVMRLSRPALASAWEPFYSNSPSFSAHSTASVLSLQGSAPLPGHPKTLRDLTNASTLLTLPSSFGAIQLGETFSGALAVNNESAAAVDGVVLRVEMQTATSKILLAELGGPTLSLVAGETLESMVHHEIKELGQHVLACTVSYQLPPGARRPMVAGTSAAAGGDVDDAGLQTFRKFYKFAVTNPLSVKTKVHVPRSPSAQLSAKERTKVFLEVHIQNLTSEPMWFERIVFEPAPEWDVQDTNLLPDGQRTLFSGSMAMMQPQDTRQYIYVLSETNPPSIPAQHAPGTILPLGRLDISWRSSFGEPGRLLTSMLSRRIPFPPNPPPPRPQQPQQMSALPLHLQRSTTVSGLSPHPPSRSSTPPAGGPAPYRPSSPFRNRPMSVPPRPQSPLTTSSAGTGSHPIAAAAAAHLVPPVDPIDVDLVVRSIPHGALPVDKPFRVACTLGVAASVREGRQRTLSLAVQHVQLQSAAPAAAPDVVAPLPTTASHLPPLAAAGATTAPSSPAARTPLVLLGGPFVGSPRTTQQLAGPEAADESTLRVPPPEPVAGDEGRYEKLRGATHFVGPSTLLVPPLTFVARTIPETSTWTPFGGGGDDKKDVGGAGATKKEEHFWEFELAYAPLKTGFVPVGGLRVLLLEDRVDGGAEAYADKRTSVPATLREWDVIGEIWVKS